jgi:hypothetical protein
LISEGVVSVSIAREFLKSGNVVTIITKAKKYVANESMNHIFSLKYITIAETITKMLDA